MFECVSIVITVQKGVSRKKNNSSVLGWLWSLRSDRNNRSHLTKTTEICLQTAAGRLTLAHTVPHYTKAGACFCSKGAWDSPFNPFIKLIQDYHFHQTSDSPPRLSVSHHPPWWLACLQGTDTRGHKRYSQLWFGLGRQQRAILPRGWRQFVWDWRWIWGHLSWNLGCDQNLSCKVGHRWRWRWGWWSGLFRWIWGLASLDRLLCPVFHLWAHLDWRQSWHNGPDLHLLDMESFSTGLRQRLGWQLQEADLSGWGRRGEGWCIFKPWAITRQAISGWVLSCWGKKNKGKLENVDLNV